MYRDRVDEVRRACAADALRRGIDELLELQSAKSDSGVIGHVRF
jgi:hypothetical protein